MENAGSSNVSGSKDAIISKNFTHLRNIGLRNIDWWWREMRHPVVELNLETQVVYTCVYR